MKKFLCACVLVAAVGSAMADAVDDLAAGTDLMIDFMNIDYSYSGFLSGSGSGIITDEDAPAACVAKEPGTLNMVLSARDLGFDFDLLIPIVGTKIDANTVRWNATSTPNVCVPATFDGQTVDLLVKRITGQLTSRCDSTNTMFEPVCGRARNVFMQQTGGDAGNWLNIEAYLFCTENSLTRIDFQLRSFVFVGAAGSGSETTRVPPNGLDVQQGTLISGGLAELLDDDDQVLSIQQRAAFSVATPNVGFVVSADAGSQPPTHITLVLKTACTAAPLSNIIQRIEMFNHAFNRWDLVRPDGPPSGVGEQTYEAVVSGNAAEYASGAGQMLARFRWFDRGTISPSWRVNTDQVYFDLRY